MRRGKPRLRRSVSANHAIHESLGSIWWSATYWKVGPYILMPNHLHLFAWPGILNADLDGWVRYWKSQFSNTIGNRSLRWQSSCFDHRLRSCESADPKRLYMINDPVRAGSGRPGRRNGHSKGNYLRASPGGESPLSARAKARPRRAGNVPG